MSFASSLASPLTGGVQAIRTAGAGPVLRTMARSVGAVAGAGILAASYQIAYEEGRQIIQNMRVGAARRRERNIQLTLALMKTGLPIEIQDSIRRARDGIGASVRMMTDQQLQPVHRDILHTATSQVLRGEIQQM